MERAKRGEPLPLLRLIRHAFRTQDDGFVERLSQAAQEGLSSLEEKAQKMEDICHLLTYLESNVWHPGHVEDEECDDLDTSTVLEWLQRLEEEMGV